jgi:hypothetical protein
MDPQAELRVNPTEADVSAGHQARFTFATLPHDAVAYSMLAEAEVSAWCRVLVPVGGRGLGEVVVDVPGDARTGRYSLRLVATAAGQTIAAADFGLSVRGERRGVIERCLRVLGAPKFSLQPDGSVQVTLQVVNCGGVDATLVVQARHRDGWSFVVEDPHLVIGAHRGPVTVKVTLRPPVGRKVDRGDQITVEVDTGTGWQPVPGRVPRPAWPWVVAAVIAGLLLAVGVAAASVDDSGDDVGTFPGDGGGDGGGDDDGTVVDGVGGDIEVDVFEVDFGVVAPGEVVEQFVLFRNVGDEAVDVNLLVEGDSDVFAAESDCTVVEPGQECELVIRFGPVSEGDYEAFVGIGEEAVELFGSSEQAVPPVEIVSLSVDADDCTVTVEWEATGDSAGWLDLRVNGEIFEEDLAVGHGSFSFQAGSGLSDGDYQVAVTLEAFDAEGELVDTESATDGSTCIG